MTRTSAMRVSTAPPSRGRRRCLLALSGLLVTGGAALAAAAAWESRDVKLPPAQTTGGLPLMQALQRRQSQRQFAPDPLPPQLLANLLWAAFGINRPASGGRTAPSAHDQQEFDIYAVTQGGTYLYDAKTHHLRHLEGRDLRALTGWQPHARQAPLTLVFVADDQRMSTGDDAATRSFYRATDAGYISQNVYLFCASEGLATVAFAAIDRAPLARALQLRPTQHIVLAQSVGFPSR